MIVEDTPILIETVEAPAVVNEEDAPLPEFIVNTIEENNVQSIPVENQDTLSDTVSTEPTLPK